jgi:hypothetical protein
MCNVALAFLSIPSIMFSISKGGDTIDQAAGVVLNEHAFRVKVLKEEGLDLSKAPKDKFEKALHIYYEDLVETLVEALRRASKAGRPRRTALPGSPAAPPAGWHMTCSSAAEGAQPAHRDRRRPHGL